MLVTCFQMAMFALRQVDPSLMGLEQLFNQRRRRARSDGHNASTEVGGDSSDGPKGDSEEPGNDSDTSSDASGSDEESSMEEDALTSKPALKDSLVLVVWYCTARDD